MSVLCNSGGIAAAPVVDKLYVFVCVGMCAFVCMTEQSCRCLCCFLTSAQSLQSVQ